MISQRLPTSRLYFRENSEFAVKTTDELFGGKRVLIFGLPGAFTPTCSAYQLPGFEEAYDEIISLGIDEVYCVSVNDAFVMNAWAKDQNIKKVKLIPDGNAYLTRSLDMGVMKSNLGFGIRSWRYAAIYDNQNLEKSFVESGIEDNVEGDPYEESTPEKVLSYLRTKE
jgi:thioredoxin-dependent peroxiredoxin